ncbi:hypothetical protein ACIGBH_29980 [Streptomyces sp. NPDC085929]|uniref:hypothetical protein n=1 Tax=Streptomyces sp. NPDC085929 TaxID=3365739 RepID=UPI0037D6CA34
MTPNWAPPVPLTAWVQGWNSILGSPVGNHLVAQATSLDGYAELRVADRRVGAGGAAATAAGCPATPALGDADAADGDGDAAAEPLGDDAAGEDRAPDGGAERALSTFSVLRGPYWRATIVAGTAISVTTPPTARASLRPDNAPARGPDGGGPDGAAPVCSAAGSAAGDGYTLRL